jgi:RNA polymerase sigma-54 factor
VGREVDDLPAAAPTLHEDLLAQLCDAWLSPAEQRVGELVIGNLDDDGFLDATTEEIAVEAEVWPDVALVERVVACVQGFDPPGIAAHDRAESFVLQLRRRGFRDDSLPVRLVRECLSALVRRPLARIAEVLGASSQEVREAARLVARLDPSPGRRASEAQARVVPDVSVDVRDGELVVRVNDEGVPRLRLSDVRATGVAAREWRRSAEWLIAALAQRRETLHAVTTSIMRAQRDFLAGTGALQPLVLRDVAAEVQRHESTVSRTVADKYVETPRGVFPLKAFFARRVAAQGDTTAARVKRDITEILAQEDAARPLSDSQIAQRLSSEGVHVSRRAVAKYREELGLPAAALRRARA